MNSRNENAPKTLAGTATLIRPERGGPLAGRGEEWVGKASTYYGVPLIKKAHWGWQIILYFFLGGTGGGAYLVATLADLLGLKDTRLIRTGRHLAFVCVLISPILLIWDLGRPERFHHMLRVIKLRSPMSLGTWALSMFGLCAGITAAYQMAEDGLLNWLPFFPRLFSAPIRPACSYASCQRRSLAATASQSGGTKGDGIAREADRGNRQLLWPFRCIVYRCITFSYCCAAMGTRKAHPGTALSDIGPFYCPCQSFLDLISTWSQSGHAREVGACRTGDDDHRTGFDLNASRGAGTTR